MPFGIFSANSRPSPITAARPARIGTAAPEWQKMKPMSGKRASVPLNKRLKTQRFVSCVNSNSAGEIQPSDGAQQTGAYKADRTRKSRRTASAAYFRTAALISEPKAYRARNRKLESTSLQRRV